jgi:hypothetical protein
MSIKQIQFFALKTIRFIATALARSADGRRIGCYSNMPAML